MHYFGVFKEVPITSSQPEGWLRKYLEIMRDGLTGHPEVCGYPFDVNYWGTEEGVEALKHDYPHQFWGSYEQTANWVEGALRCGYLLRDPYLIKKASQPLDYVLTHADTDGYLGPQFLKYGGWRSRYPHALFFRAMMSYYSATGDDCIPNAVKNHYLSGTRPHSDELEVCNLEAILWAYEVTKDERLREHAIEAYEQYNQLSEGKDTTLKEMLSMKRATEHGVTYNKITRLGAVLYLYTGDKTCLNATINAYRKMDRDQMLVDGVPSSAEMLAGKHPLDSHETCDINVFTWSLRYLLQATGNAEYADKIERACFNAAPGCVTSDFKALQYFSCPNQVVANSFSNHNLWFRGYSWMSYRPSPGVECCPGNVHRIMPHFASHTWLQDSRGGPVAALYAPCSVMIKVGEPKQEVTITEMTDYPFSESIEFIIHTSGPIEFPFTFRIPSWCNNAHASINGQAIDQPLVPGTFVTLNRVFSDNDRVSLTMPMALKLSYWPQGGISIERGPLVYALKIEEDWRVVPDDAPPISNYRQIPAGRRSTPDFPAWDLYPASPWNYALAVKELDLDKRVKIIKKPMSEHPWSIHQAPIELQVPARRIKKWVVEKSKQLITMHMNKDNTSFVTEPIYGNFMLTPPLPEVDTVKDSVHQEEEIVTLVPYGCTHLRITIFPQSV